MRKMKGFIEVLTDFFWAVLPFAVFVVVVTVLYMAIALIMAIPKGIGNDWNYGISAIEPEIPEGSIKVEVLTWEVCDRFARSSSRSSAVRYELVVKNSDDTKAKEITVSKDEFITAQDGATYYEYWYTVPHDDMTYGQRLNTVLTKYQVCIITILVALIAAVVIFSIIKFA